MTSALNTNANDLLNRAFDGLKKPVFTGVVAEGINFGVNFSSELLGSTIALGPSLLTGALAGTLVVTRNVAQYIFNEVYSQFVPENIKAKVPAALKTDFAAKVIELGTYAALGAAVVQFGPALGVALTVAEVAQVVALTVFTKMVVFDLVVPYVNSKFVPAKSV